MQELKIACGNSRKAKVWANKAISFDDLCKRLKTPVRTTETAEEYRGLPKAQKDEIKDKGGFVGGHLKDGRRQKDKVASRSMLVYDLDNIPKDYLSEVGEHFPNQGCWYTTHSHTPEKPRARVIIPTSRDMTPDEFNAVARYYAADNGFIDVLDPCCFLAHQLMYWPTCSSDGEYLFGMLDGEGLDPDKVLMAHPEWKDCSQLPTAPKESAALNNKVKCQADPYKKEGVVGAMCRAYTIQEVIEAYLSDIYAPSADDPNRYDYIPGEGSSGVVIYDDKFAYSHHATDPAGGRLCNAFDLVRIHKFGDLDEKKSFSQMCELALADDKVKIEIAREREEQARMDFKEAELMDAKGSDGSKDSGDWRSQLRYMKGSTVLENSVWNEMLILNNDPDFANFAYNELANRVQVTGDMPWGRPPENKFWRDADTAQLKALLDVRYVPFSSRNHDVAFAKVADDRRFHPVRDYLDSLPEWDRIPRVETILVRYLQAEDTPYTRAVTRKTLAAAVARAYEPGVKFDSILVLDGIQGIGKSTLFKELCGEEFYSDTLSLTDMNDKSGAEKLQGFWIVEIGELAGMKKADIEKVKAFLSTSDDKYRPSYGRTVESHPRQCIIVASVNGERGYLRDITGNRRFWVVKLNQTEQRKTWDISKEERDQIWAEAKYLWESGEKLYLEGDMIREAEKAQRQAMELDERQGMVEDYLETLLPEGWNSMDLYDRRDFFHDGNDSTRPAGVHKRETVSNAEIWCECFGNNPSDMKPADSYAIAALMTQIEGWERTTRRSHLPIYGYQRLYVRTD